MTSPHPTKQHLTRRTGSAGFTLIETALTMVIIGVGVLAMVSAQQAYHMKNDWAMRTGNAQQLAQELREATMGLPHHDPHVSGSYGLETGETSLNLADYDDLDDFAGTVDMSGYGGGTSFSPPIGADGSTITELDRWTQVINVVKVFDDNISSASGLPLNYDSPMMRATVKVYYKNPETDENDLITTLSWVVTE